MNRLSMSRYPLALLCSYWARPDVTYTELPVGRAARIGTLVHGLMEAKVTGRSVMHEADPHELAEAIAIFNGPFSVWLESRKWTACEIGLRYDAENDTAAVGPRRGEPGYDDHGAMILKGTLDLVEVTDDAVWVPDLKTGKKANAHIEQVIAQGVAVARLYGKKKAHVGFVFAMKTKCEEPAWVELDADALDAEAGRIGRTLRRLPTVQPVDGEHCWRCDMKKTGTCPKWQARAEKDLEEAGFFGDREVA